MQVRKLAAIRKTQRTLPKEDGGQDPSPCEPFPPNYSSSQNRTTGLGVRGGLRGGSSSLAIVADPTDASNPDRAWLYQTCTEFGFYQASPFSFLCSSSPAQLTDSAG